MAKAALLISRQPLQPSGSTPWVQSTVKAVRWIRQNGHSLVSSVGMPTWELITALAAMERIPLWLILPPLVGDDNGFDTSAVISDFGLDPELTTVFNLKSTTRKESKADRLCRRDERIVSEADILIPIAVNPNGNMTSLLVGHRERKACLDTFQVAPERRPRPLGFRIAEQEVNSLLAELGGQFLFHWTRSSNSPWPDESPLDYYRDIVPSHSYPRNAYETLRHIIACNKIIASPWRMPNKIPTVSFSALSPVSMPPLMRWRARYRRMSFEPYAIGIRRSTAEDLGVRPVSYYRIHNPLTGTADIWLSQSQGHKTDWRHECEYRHRGDLDLATINTDNLVLITRTPSEASHLSQATGLRVLPFICGD